MKCTVISFFNNQADVTYVENFNLSNIQKTPIQKLRLLCINSDLSHS